MIFVFAVLSVILLGILSFRIKSTHQIGEVEQEPTDRDLVAARRALLTRVRSDLEAGGGQGMPIHTWLPLQYTNRIDLCRDTIYSQPQHSPRQPIEQVFQQFGQGSRLLIVGRPGSGKTIVLSLLAWKLVCERESYETDDISVQIPVVLALSTWGREEVDFVTWASKSLHGYGIPVSVGKRLIREGNLMLFLDGLNEMPVDARESFVDSMNQYGETHSEIGFAVTCQEQPYEQLAKKLVGLQRAIEIIQADRHEVKTYLKESSAFGSHDDLYDNQTLMELARDPVYFSIINNVSPEFLLTNISDDSHPVEIGRRLFTIYSAIQINLRSRKVDADLKLSPKEVVHWLEKLAGNMKRSGDRPVSLDQIQPDRWLMSDGKSTPSYRLYAIVTILITTLIMTFFVGLAVIPNRYAGCIHGVSNCSPLVDQLKLQSCTPTYNPLWGLVATTVFAVLFGLAFWKLQNRALGLVLALALSLALGISDLGYRCAPFAAVIFFGNLFAWSVGAFLFFKPGSDKSNIAFDWRRVIIVEKLRWSWTGGAYGLLFGVAIGLVLGAVTSSPGWGIAWGLGLGLIVVAIRGFERDKKPSSDPSPIAGIRQSGRNAVFVGSIMMAVCAVGVIIAFSILTKEDRSDAIFYGCLGLGLGAVGMLFGGLTVVQHNVLMWILQRNGNVPTDTVGFLHEAMGQKMMKQTHRNFDFVHELLLDLFSDLKDDEKEIILGGNTPFRNGSNPINILHLPMLTYRTEEYLHIDGGAYRVSGTQTIQESTTTKIKILFLAANPVETSRLSLDKEANDIEREILSAKFGRQFAVRRHGAISVSDLQRTLEGHEPQIVHFGGHGLESGELVFEDERGRPQPVSVGALSDTFRLLSDNLRCVVLSACFAKLQAEAIAEHVDCVIGVPAEIGDREARLYSVGFYRAVANGHNVKHAHELGINEVRLHRREADHEILTDHEMPRLIAYGDPSKLVFAR